MTQQFTASEVRDSAIAVAARDMQYEAKMLHAYAERLEADEKAVPVAWLRESGVDIESEGGCITNAVRNLWLASNPKRVERYTIPLFTHPSPSDAERIARRMVAEYDAVLCGDPTATRTDGMRAALEAALAVITAAMAKESGR